MWHTSSKCHQLEWIAIPLIHIMHKHMKAWQTQNLQIFDKIVQVQIALDYCKLTLDLILTMLSRNLTIFIQRIHSHSWQKVQRRPRYTCVCVCVCTYLSSSRRFWYSTRHLLLKNTRIEGMNTTPHWMTIRLEKSSYQ